MKVCISILAVVCLHVVFGQNEYVVPNSVICETDGISFRLQNDVAKSDLAKDTALDVNLFTQKTENGAPTRVPVTGYNPKDKNVKIIYTDYLIFADIIYGENKQPLLYSIRQPFDAVPTDPAKQGNRLYKFIISCIAPATATITDKTGTGESGPGDGGGGVVDPSQHISAKLDGPKNGISLIGDPLKFTIQLTTAMYGSLVPINCRYHNPGTNEKSFYIVTNSCPLDYEDKDGWFGKMKKITDRQFTLDFRAFRLTNDDSNNLLAITCQVLMCLPTDEVSCKSKACWDAPTAAPTPPTLPPPEEPGDGGGDEGGDEGDMARRQSKNSQSSGKIATFHFNMAADNKSPDTFNQGAVVRVEPASFQQSPICTDQSLLNALYAVIGVLAGLVLILVFGLIGLLYAARKRKVMHYS